MIITDTDGLKTQIRELMRPENGERLIAVAFIGKDALQYVPDPHGVTIYCWDNVTGTHPDGIEDLLNAGARVKFVPRLHMKLFWAEQGGALIGSANLSNNALGQSPTALFEAAYITDDSNEIDIERLRRQLERRADEITPSVLNSYRRRYFAASARREQKSGRKAPDAVYTFSEYMRGSHRKPWILLAWKGESDYSKRELDAANRAADSEGYRGNKRGVDLIRDGVTTGGKGKVGDWILSYESSGKGTIGRLSWMYVHALSDARNPTALQLIFDAGRVPFEPDRYFKRALH